MTQKIQNTDTDIKLITQHLNNYQLLNLVGQLILNQKSREFVAVDKWVAILVDKIHALVRDSSCVPWH